MDRIRSRPAMGSADLRISARHGRPWPQSSCTGMESAFARRCSRSGSEVCRCGYFVLLPDCTTAPGPYEPMDPAEMLGEPETARF